MEITDLWSDEVVERTASTRDTAIAVLRLAAGFCVWRGGVSVFESSKALFGALEATDHGLQHKFCSLWKTHSCARQGPDRLACVGSGVVVL